MSDHPITNLGSVIVQARNQKEMSIRELARLAKVSPTTIQHLEKGNDCKLSVVVRVLSVFGLEVGIDEPPLEGYNRRKSWLSTF